MRVGLLRDPSLSVHNVLSFSHLAAARGQSYMLLFLSIFQTLYYRSIDPNLQFYHYCACIAE